MERNEPTPQNPPKLPAIQELFEKCLGCKWTLHVLGQIRRGTIRPGELGRSAPGLTTKVLNDRLAKLVRLGILERQAFPEVPPRVEYRFSPFGNAFVEILDQVEDLQKRFPLGSE